jgi:hypothetical protein
MDSTYLVPTRGRPANAVRLAQAFRDTCRGDDTRLEFFVDDDDPELPNYEVAFLDRSLDDCHFGYNVGPRLRLGGTLNRHAPVYAGMVSAVGFMGDDHVPRTVGWDVQLLEHVRALPGAVVYGNDLLQGPNIPTAVLLDSRLVTALGWMVPPGLVHLYMDNFWKELGQRLTTLRYRGDVVIEHMHPVAGKTAWDDRYAEVNAGSVYEADEKTYEAFRVNRVDGMAAALERCQAAIAA